MARSKANVGYKSQFWIGDTNSPITYTQISEVKSIKGFEMATPVVDVSHLQSPFFTKEKRPGMMDPGTVEIKFNFTADSSQLAILSLQQNQTLFPFKALSPAQNGAKTYQYTGQGFVSKYTPGTAEPDKVNEGTMTMEVDGFVTEILLDTALPAITS
jgi:hypothetical protein